MPKELRAKILIDCEETIELDYSGLHVKLLYAQRGEVAPEDPYKIDKQLFPGVTDRGEQRRYAKILLLTAINAPDRAKAYAGFRKKLHDEGDTLRMISNNEIEHALDEILKLNRAISNDVCSNKGLSLMKVDSEVTAYIIDHLTDRNIPVLTIHDSYIVKRQHENDLRNVMSKAMYDLVGVGISFK